jgi:hypothetical protein
VQFPPELAAPKFPALFECAFASWPTCSGRAFLCFTPLLPHLPPEAVRVVVAHPRFRDLLTSFQAYDAGPRCRRALFGAVQAAQDDPLCRAALPVFLESLPDQLVPSDLDYARAPVAAGCALQADTIEKFMGAVWQALQIGNTDDFRSGCTFAIVLLRHPDVRPRFDPRERRYFEAVAAYLNDRGSDPAVRAITRDFIADYCGEFGRAAVVRFLEEGRTVGCCFLRCSLAGDVAAELGRLWDHREIVPQDILRAAMWLLPQEGPVPGWVAAILAKVAGQGLWYLREARKLARAVARRGTEADARAVVAAIAASAKGSDEWHVIADVCRHWPQLALGHESHPDEGQCAGPREGDRGGVDGVGEAGIDPGG